MMKFQLLALVCFISNELSFGQKCNYPITADRIPNRNDPFSYLECGPPGYYIKKNCPSGTSFDPTSMKCGQMPHWIVKGNGQPPPFLPPGNRGQNQGPNPFFPPQKSNFVTNQNNIDSSFPRNNNNGFNNNNNNGFNDRNNGFDNRNNGFNNNGFNNNNGPNNRDYGNNNFVAPDYNGNNNNQNTGPPLSIPPFNPPPPRPFQPQVKAFEPSQNNVNNNYNPGPHQPFRPQPYNPNQQNNNNNNNNMNNQQNSNNNMNNQLPRPPLNNNGRGPSMVLPPDPGSEYPIELYSSCKLGDMCPHNPLRLQYCSFSGAKFLQCTVQGWMMQECPGGAVFRNGRCSNGFDDIYQEPSAPPQAPRNNRQNLQNLRPYPPTSTPNSFNPNTPIQIVNLPGPHRGSAGVNNNPNPQFNPHPRADLFNGGDNFVNRRGRDAYRINSQRNTGVFSNRVMHINRDRPWYRPSKKIADTSDPSIPAIELPANWQYIHQESMSRPLITTTKTTQLKE